MNKIKIHYKKTLDRGGNTVHMAGCGRGRRRAEHGAMCSARARISCQPDALKGIHE